MTRPRGIPDGRAAETAGGRAAETAGGRAAETPGVRVLGLITGIG
jgi:hypothetical protein